MHGIKLSMENGKRVNNMATIHPHKIIKKRETTFHKRIPTPRKLESKVGGIHVEKPKGESARSKIERGAATVGKGIKTIGGSIMKLGQYGASLNWENESQVPQKQPKSRKTTKGKKQRKQRGEVPTDPVGFGFEMPEFPF